MIDRLTSAENRLIYEAIEWRDWLKGFTLTPFAFANRLADAVDAVKAERSKLVAEQSIRKMISIRVDPRQIYIEGRLISHFQWSVVSEDGTVSNWGWSETPEKAVRDGRAFAFATGLLASNPNAD